MKRSLLCFGIILFLMTPSFCQVDPTEYIKISGFREQDDVGCLPRIHYNESDINGNSYSYIFFYTDNISKEDLGGFRFYSNSNTHIIIENLGNKIILHITCRAKELTVSHPKYGRANVSFPPLEPGKEYAMDLSIKYSSGVYSAPKNSNSSFSYYCAVYDKTGKQYATALLISTSGKPIIRIQSKGRGGQNDEYELTKSDKEGFSYRTTGKSEIEPLYVK